MINPGYNISGPKTQRESANWKTTSLPKRKKVRQQTSAGKHMLMAFFDWQDLVYQHFVSQDLRIDRWYYLKVLQKVREHTAKKRPHLKKGWVLHHDNARPHVAKEVTPFLQKHNTEVMMHPPYSPYLSPCDF